MAEGRGREYEEPKLKVKGGDGFWKLPSEITITA